MNFKYKTNFSNNLKVDQLISIANSYTSQASKGDLNELIPQDIDFDQNIDILGVAFNAAVVNTINKNDDGIDTITAKKIRKYFLNKPTNVEHNKKKVVGHIVSTGFSDFSSGNLIKDIPDEFSGKFNIALGAVVYSHSFPEFSKLVLKSSDEEDELYESVSASWELGFNEYNIALGSKDLNEAEIVTDEKQVKELSEYLRSFDGEGELKDGTPIYRVVAGEVYPLGIGFTGNPAADVKGVLVHKKKEEIEAEEFEEEDLANKNQKKTSQNEKIDVNNDINQISNMQKQELIEEFKVLLDEKMPEHNFTQEAVANISRVIGDAIKSKSDEYEKELSAIDAQKEELQKVEANLKEEIESLRTELTQSKGEVESLNGEILESQKEEAFNARMETIEASYEINDQDKKLLAKEVQELSLDEKSFEEYTSKLQVMWAHKNKKYLEEQEKIFAQKVEAEVQKRISGEDSTPAEKIEATEEVVEVEEVLAEVTEEASEIATNNNLESATEEPTLKEKFSMAFARENISVKF
jgi:hypothetical protein